MTTLTRDEAMARLDEHYQLIYVGIGDRLSDDEVENLVSGDYESLWESLTEFESESLHTGAWAVIENEFTCEEWDSLSLDPPYRLGRSPLRA